MVCRLGFPLRRHSICLCLAFFTFPFVRWNEREVNLVKTFWQVSSRKFFARRISWIFRKLTTTQQKLKYVLANRLSSFEIIVSLNSKTRIIRFSALFRWDQALDLLVSVSSTHYCAYTSDLSTLSSLRGLTLSVGYLILRSVSRLDAFSVYLLRTSLPCRAAGATTGAQ